MPVGQNPQDYINQIIASDPDIQKVIKSVWGETTVHQRPSDTPKHLEKANHRASQQIKQILASKGIELPARTFINPRSSTVEGMRGWAGLPPAVKIAIIAGAAVATGGALSAAGAFGGAAGAAGGAAGSAGAAGGAAIPGIAATTGLGGLTFGTPVALGGLGLGAAGAGTLASTSLAGSAALPAAGSAGNMAGMAGGGGAAKGGVLSQAGNYARSLLSKDGLEAAGQGIGALNAARARNRGTELDAMMEADRMRMDLNRERRADEDAIMSNLSAARYIKSGGTQHKPAVSSSGQTLPTFGLGLPAITDDDKAAATTLESQLLTRLNNVPQLSDYESKMKPGKVEGALNWIGPALSIASGRPKRPTGNG